MTTYHPKGGQCVQCQRKSDNCKDLPFSTMKVIGHYEDKAIVACTEYRRVNLHPGAHKS